MLALTKPNFKGVQAVADCAHTTEAARTAPVQIRHWSADYIGLPWRARGDGRDGLDCWNLCRLVYHERLGIELESYSSGYVTAFERAEIAALISGARAQAPWREIAPGNEREFDIAIFRCAGLATHIGIVTAPGQMLHVNSGQDSMIERYRDGKWLPRLIGFQRHESAHVG